MEWESIQTTQDYLQWLSLAKKTPYRRGLEQARCEIADVDPRAAARKSGAIYKVLQDGSGRGVFILPFLGRKYIIGRPGFKIVEAETRQEPSTYRQIILLHYLKHIDDAYVPAGFISFGRLPYGRPYEHSLQKNSLEPLARAFGENVNQLRIAAQKLEARPLPVKEDSGLAYSFWPLPRLPMGIILTPGDNEFPSRAQLLVDINTEHWLPIYDTAIVGRLLCQTLIQLKPTSKGTAGLYDIVIQKDGALYGGRSF